MSDDLQSNTDISEPSTEYSQENSASINNDAEQNYRSQIGRAHV